MRLNSLLLTSAKQKEKRWSYYLEDHSHDIQVSLCCSEEMRGDAYMAALDWIKTMHRGKV